MGWSLIASFSTASRYGKCWMSCSWMIARGVVILLESSCFALARIGGLRRRSAIAHSRVVVVLWVPPMNKS